MQKNKRRQGDWTGTAYSYCPTCGNKLHCTDADDGSAVIRCYRCWPTEIESPEDEVRRLRRKLGAYKREVRRVNKGCRDVVASRDLAWRDLGIARQKLYETRSELQDAKREISRLNYIVGHPECLKKEQNEDGEAL